MNDEQEKASFLKALRSLTDNLSTDIATMDGQWTVKGFIDVYRSIYTISSDTKVVSKILEIHLFPRLLAFAEEIGYGIVLADHQNYYPDLSFVKANSDLKFAVDFKTTYRRAATPGFCNGFTLGSHGKYFTDRDSTKNIQFPYKEYAGHYCLGIIYSRHADRDVDETRAYRIEDLQSIASVIRDIQFFVQEKWRIASDQRGSGNTANIGSINRIDDIVAGNGMFSVLGEEWFDDLLDELREDHGKDPSGKTRPIRRLTDFVSYRGGDPRRWCRRRHVLPRAVDDASPGTTDQVPRYQNQAGTHHSTGDRARSSRGSGSSRS